VVRFPFGRTAPRRAAWSGRYLALGEPAQQVLRGQVHELDLVRLVQQVVGEGLAHHDAGDALDEVVDALQMLDVQCRPHVDAGLQELSRVLPALGVARSGSVGVGELVEEEQAGPAGESGVDVELREPDPAVLDLVRANALEALGQGRRLGPAVRLHPADDDVHSRGALGPGRLEHGVRLPDPGGGPEEHLEPPALRLLALDLTQEGIGVRPLLAHQRLG
jgi:hypothetical protein